MLYLDTIRRPTRANMDILSRIIGRHSQSTGQLGYFGLTGWWMSSFSAAERDYMEAVFRTSESPADSKPLTRDRGGTVFQTAAGLLTILADRLSERSQDRDLASRVLAKAEQRALAVDDTLGLHLVYHQVIRLHNRWKDTFPDARDVAFAACHKQIRLAPQAAKALRQKRPNEPLPVHLGYLFASTMLERDDAYEAAIELCRQAKSEGWAGDWLSRIQQLNKKLCENGQAVKSMSPSGVMQV
jgi:hypothetical protein